MVAMGLLIIAIVVNLASSGTRYSLLECQESSDALEARSFVGLSASEGPPAAALAWPSGMWRGYYHQYGSRHSLCDFSLQFHAGEVTGAGTDGVGGYRIQGVYNGSRVAFTKQYVRSTATRTGRVDHQENLGHAVEYRGQVVETNFGAGVRGRWYISRSSSGYSGNGDFHLWPAMEGWHRLSAPPLEDPESMSLPSAPPFHVTQGNVCVVCFERPINVGLQPCNHVAICRSCASRLSPPVCPICRTPIARLSGADGGQVASPPSLVVPQTAQTAPLPLCVLHDVSRHSAFF
jgi:hypothetical protein